MPVKVLRDRRDAGFTLIELLVVIIIIGILAAIAIPVFLNQRQKGVDATVKSDLKQLATVMETYITDNPSTNGTNVKADLLAYGFKASNSTEVIYAATHDTKGGYCLMANMPGMTNYVSNNYVFYDSGAGGFLNGGKPINFPAGTVSCSTGRGPLSSPL